MKNRLVHLTLIALLGALFLPGCVRQGPIIVDFRYQAPEGAAAGAPKATVAVSPFKDERGKGDSVAGKRFTTLTEETNDLVVQGTIRDKVEAALKSALAARNITAKDAAWDQTEAAVPATGTDLLISGEIKSLWLDCVSKFASTTAKADVRLRIVVADPAQKKIIKILNVSSALERQNVGYSTQFVEDTLAEALSAAINQVFADEELKNRLK